MPAPLSFVHFVCFVGSHLLILAALGATAYVAGRMLAWRLSWESRLERLALSTALGLAALAQLGLLLGLAGRLDRGAVLPVVAALHLLGLPAWRELAADGAEARRKLRRRPAFAVLGGAAVLVPFAALALYPPTGFDATLYHLPFARAFVETGSLPFLPDLRFPVFPQGNEVLFAALMLFGGDVAAQGVELVSVLLTAALVLVWGRRDFPAGAGWLAAAAVLGNPIVAYLGGQAYIEAGLALFATASLYALRRWTGAGEGSWLALAAAFAGAAASVKYLGLFFCGVVLAAAVLLPGRGSPLRDRWRERLRSGTLAALVLLAAAGPWYGRIVAFTENPVFPYGTGVFGSSLWAPQHEDLANLTGAAPADSTAGSGALLLRRFVLLLRVPWDAVFERQGFGQQPPFSPVYLLALPLAALAAVRDRRLRTLLLIAGSYSFACMALPRDSRYLVPVLPLASLAAGAVFARGLAVLPAFAARRRLSIAVLGAGLLLPGWLYALYRVERQGPLPVTPAQRESYLRRSLPLYPAIADLNRTRGSDFTLYGLYTEEMAYFAEGRYLGDWFGPASYHRRIFGTAGAEDLHRRLRLAGADHLLVSRSRGRLPVAEDEAFRRRFREVYADSAARIFELRRK